MKPATHTGPSSASHEVSDFPQIKKEQNNPCTFPPTPPPPAGKAVWRLNEIAYVKLICKPESNMQMEGKRFRVYLDQCVTNAGLIHEKN